MRWLSAGGVFLMMVVAFVDVVGRKFLDQPLRGSVELTELLMLMVVFIGVALVSHDRNHVQLDLLDSAVPVRWQALRERAGEFLSGLIMLGAGWLALTRALQAGREGELTALLRISMAPAFAIVAVLLAIAYVRRDESLAKLSLMLGAAVAAIAIVVLLLSVAAPVIAAASASSSASSSRARPAPAAGSR